MIFNLVRPIVYSASVFFFASCANQKQDYAILSGTFHGTKLKEITFSKLDQTFEKSIPLAGNGTFTDTIRISHAGTYQVNGIDVYLDKGYRLNMEYSLNGQIQTTKFTGEGEGTLFNNYLIKSKKQYQKIMGADIETFYTLDKAAFKAKLIKMLQGCQKFLDSVPDVPAELEEKEKRNIMYTVMTFAEGYNSIPSNNQKIDAGDYQTMFREFEPIQYTNEEDLRYSSYYSGLIRRHYDSVSVKLVKKAGISTEQADFKTISAIPSEAMRNTLTYIKASGNMATSANMKGYYAQFMKLNTNDHQRKKITEVYTNFKRTFPGEPSPEFADYENHAGGKISLNDLRGTYLYIDVWATWCGPCIEEIPFLKKVEQQYGDKNIRFVSISVDKEKDHEKWRRMVNDKNLGGM